MTDRKDPEEPVRDVLGQIARGVGWMVLLRFCVRGLGIVSTLILVRLLTPQDFGLVGMATAFIAIVQVFAWFNFDLALIQKRSAARAHYDTAWTLNIIFSCTSALVLLAGAYPVSLFYDETRVVAIIAVLAASVLIGGFENVGVVNFRKTMSFDKEFNYHVWQKVAAFAVTVPLAFALRSYWALIIGVLVGNVVRVSMSYRLQPYRPRLDLSARSELFGFSKWVFFNGVLHAVWHRSVHLIIGRVSGPESLGLFTVSHEISTLPSTELVAPINRAVFPGYAKLSSRQDGLREGYLKVVGAIALIAVPAGVGIAATAPVLVPVALGAQWLSATPLVIILSLYGVVMALQTNITSVYLALGRPQVLTVLYGLGTAVMLAIAVPAALHHGVRGAALAFLASALLTVPVNFAFVLRAIALPFPRFFSRLWRPIGSAAIMYAAVDASLDPAMTGSTTIAGLLHLLTLCSIGALIYAAAVLGLWTLSGRPEGAERDALDALRRHRRGRQGTAGS